MSAGSWRAPAAPDSIPDGVAALAVRLRSTRERLRARTSAALAGSLGAAGSRFLDPADEVRREALARLPESAGLSSAVCEALLDGMAADWTEQRLRTLLRIELGEPCALDAPVERGGGRSLAIGPSLCVQIAAGGVPGVGVTALVRSLLVKAPTLLKPGRGDALLPTLYARALAQVDAALAESLAVVYWPSGSLADLDAALSHADLVVAYGSDDSVASVGARTPVTARFVPYHHRVSVGLVGREALALESARAVAADVAAAVSAYDQRGCVSPQVVFVEEGGACPPAEFAALVARAMEEVEARHPAGALAAADASRLQQARGTAELMAAETGGEVHHGGAAAWTVVWEPRGGATLATAGRFVRLRPVVDAEELAATLLPLGAHLQTVGVAGLGERLEAVARMLGEVGASRIAPFRAVPFPPPWWHHDGRGPLLDLVRWVDLEPTTLPGSAAPPAR